MILFIEPEVSGVARIKVLNCSLWDLSGINVLFHLQGMTIACDKPFALFFNVPTRHLKFLFLNDNSNYEGCLKMRFGGVRFILFKM